MAISFDNQVAVVTGAGRGLGRCYALEMARRGASVVVNDAGVSPDGKGKEVSVAQSVVAEIKAFGGEAVANTSSVAGEQSAGEIIKTAINNYGTIDILINNAGTLRDRSFVKMSAEDFKEVVKVHLLGAYFPTWAAFPVFKEKKYGRIIMTTSVSALYGNFGQANYNAAKMGVVGLMNALKEEGKKYNILVNTVAPLAASRLGQGIFPEEFMSKIDPEHVAALVVYLCSNICNFSGYIFSAGGGFYTRVQLFEGNGYLFKEGNISAEMVAEKMDIITDMSEKSSFANSTEAVVSMAERIMQKAGRNTGD